MALVARNPLFLVNELQRDMHRLFDNRRQAAASGSESNGARFSPAVDIHEDDTAYHLSVELPGVKSDAIEVTAERGTLSIRGKREVVHADKQNKRSERVFGAFVREFSLPEAADLEKIEAKSQDGVLYLTVPKTAKVEPRRIVVQ